MSPLVTAIIPTYNRAGELCRAIESVLAQTYQNIELIVVDDGSTDDTQARLSRYGNKVRVIRQANAGPGAARNHGIRLCKGEIVTFLDSDDLWLPTKVERQVSLLLSAGNSVPCCLCNTVLRFADGTAAKSFDRAHMHPRYKVGIWHNVTELLLTRFVLFNQAVAIRRAALEQIGGFDEYLWCLEDHDLALRLSILGDWVYTAEPLAVWTEGASGSLSKRALANTVELLGASFRLHNKIRQQIVKQDATRQLGYRVRRELIRIRLLLRARKFAASGSSIGVITCRLVNCIDKYRLSTYRRTPWFPRMKATQLPVCQ